MFTGIITHIGIITRIDKKGDWRIEVEASGFTTGLQLGASVALNGVCLTIIRKSKNGFVVQVSKETLARTTLGSWKKGTRINLERALRMGDELGGHFVSGHVDGMAVLKKKKKVGDSFKLTFSAPKRLGQFIAEKGSVTIDGVSLTVNETTRKGFAVNVIPHTLTATTLGGRKAGDAVNLEVDVIARYIVSIQGKKSKRV